MSMFNNQGQLNASSVRDALMVLNKYAALQGESLPSNMGLSGPSTISNDQREELISRALLREDGKRALAQVMANPIRRNLDYQGIARRAVVVEPLSTGALPVFDRDIDATAFVISSNGAAQEYRVMGDRFTVPLFEIVSHSTVKFHEVKARRFNVIDRAVQKMRQEIMAEEDRNVFTALSAASAVDNTVQDITDTGMLRRDLIEIKTQVERWDLVASKFFMHINEFNDILTWGSGGGTGASDVDPVTEREILQTGLKARFWGADIIVSKIVPPGTVYCCADKEFVGVMPVRQDIEVIPADEPRRTSLGWVANEIIGIGIGNARGVARGDKNQAVG